MIAAATVLAVLIPPRSCLAWAGRHAGRLVLPPVRPLALHTARQWQGLNLGVKKASKQGQGSEIATTWSYLRGLSPLTTFFSEMRLLDIPTKTYAPYIGLSLQPSLHHLQASRQDELHLYAVVWHYSGCHPSLSPHVYMFSDTAYLQ